MIVNITGGQVKIDREDLELVSSLKWHVGSTGYAVWRGVKGGKKQTIRMHRLVMDCPDGMVIDHLNHDPLDNRKANLRVCTQSDNMRNLQNQGKGYWYQKQNSNWVVEIYGKHIGTFKTEEEAQEVVKLVRGGGTYIKPERTVCKYGHSLEDAYHYKNGKICKTCHAERCKQYFKRSYVPKPREEVRYCPRGHDRRITKTIKGDCRKCATIRAKEYRDANTRRNN
jgi:hypothetical protein